MFTVRVPATIANMGPGFDSFGMALSFHNRFHAAPAERDVIRVAANADIDTGDISPEPSESLIFQALKRFYTEIGKPRPALDIEIEPVLPLARGLGSSSTAIVGGLVLGNELAGRPLDNAALVRLATELEGHPDNVAPALLGGVLLCDGERTFSLPWPEDWAVTVIISPEKILTEDARRVLPKSLSYGDAIFNLRKASLLTYALLRADGEAFSRSLEDRLHQPYRGKLIPHFGALSEVAAAEGAFGTIVSGSGSTLAVFHPQEKSRSLVAALQTFAAGNTPSLKVLPMTLDTAGAQVLTAPVAT